MLVMWFCKFEDRNWASRGSAPCRGPCGKGLSFCAMMFWTTCCGHPGKGGRNMRRMLCFRWNKRCDQDWVIHEASLSLLSRIAMVTSYGAQAISNPNG